EDDFNDPGKEQFGPGFRRKLFRVAADGSWQEIINGVEQPAEGPCSWLRRHWVGLTLALLAALLAVAGWYWLAGPRGRAAGLKPNAELGNPINTVLEKGDVVPGGEDPMAALLSPRAKAFLL